MPTPDELTKTAATAIDTAAAQVPATQANDEFSDLIADAGKGTELIGANDVKPPRLLLCQSGSPQRKPDNLKQIKGLEELDLFNALSNQIYGRSLRFVVIASLGSHWIEFDEELKVVELNVPEGDPRTLWRTKEDGSRLKPIAVHFYDYLLWLPDHMEVVVFSFKSTQISNAFKLNGMLRLPIKIGDKIIANPPSWARVFKLTTKMQSDKGFEWGGFNLDQDGITPRDVRASISDLAKTYKDLKIEIDRTDDAADVAAEAAAAGDGTGQPTGQGDPEDM